MDMERAHQGYHHLKRVTVARSALDVIALIFLVCSFAFWAVAFWQLLMPPAVLSLLSIQAVVLALVYSLATPLLWSALVPTTPAGQLLQKTQWRTIGFFFIIGAALYLSFQAEQLIETWLAAQPAIGEAGMARQLAFSLAIAFILIPALAWTQLTPERWLQQIQQAHMVRKLEVQQAGELAILKNRMIWAAQKALVGYANLLPAEQQEVWLTISGLCKGINDGQRAIARTLGISAEMERAIMDDEQVAAQLEYVADAVERTTITLHQPALESAPVERAEIHVPTRASGASERAEALPRTYTEPHIGAHAPAATRGEAPRYAEEYAAARAAQLPAMWNWRQLSPAIGDRPERTCRDIIDTWKDLGWVRAGSNGFVRFTESEG